MYDAAGQRVAKIVKPRTGGTLQSEDKWEYTVYSRDASGNVLAVYKMEYKSLGGNDWQMIYDLRENHLYNNRRIGISYDQQAATTRDFNLTLNSTFDFMSSNLVWNSNPVKPVISQTNFSRTLGNKSYEFVDRVGNVIAVLSDRRLAVGSSGNVSHYLPEVNAYTMYYSYGMSMPGLTYVGSNGNYRGSFNGKETDQETSLQDYGFRIYNPALGKFLSVDPLAPAYPMLTPYQFASNNPVRFIDLDGLEAADLDINDPNVQLMHQWSKEEGSGGTILNNSYYNRYKSAQATAFAVGAVVAVAAVTGTLGPVLNTASTVLLCTSVASIAEHNQQKDPVARQQQIKRENDALVNSAIMVASIPLARITVSIAGNLVVRTIMSSSIRFSQRTVNGIAEWEVRMKEAGGWVGEPIDIVKMKDGIYTSVDNTRLAAARNVGYEVQAVAHNFDDPISIEQAQRFINQKTGSVPTTWGEAVTNRIQNQGTNFATQTPNGTFVIPKDNSTLSIPATVQPTAEPQPPIENPTPINPN